MKPPKRRDVIEIGPFKVHLKLVSHDLAYEVGEQQGSFHSKPPLTIVLDENIMLLENENTLLVKKSGAGQELKFEIHKFGDTNEIMKEAKAFKIDMDSIAECTYLTKYFGPYWDAQCSKMP